MTAIKVNKKDKQETATMKFPVLMIADLQVPRPIFERREVKNLIVFLRLLGLYPQDVKRDGNCQVRAIADQVFYDQEDQTRYDIASLP